MKTATTLFKDSIKAPGLIGVRQVYYKRRYWDQEDAAYVWESSWTLLPETEIQNVSPISMKLDTDRLNEWKVANLTLNVKNQLNQWSQYNVSGLFKPDSSSPLGYEAYWTKFQVKYGYVLSDGTTEMITVFVGLATEFTADLAGHTMQIKIDGLESLLMNANAENVSTTVTEEAAGTGDASETEFTTAQPGVGIIDEVALDGIAQKPGTDYNVSQLNEPELGAKITFETAPGVGVDVTITYRYWKQQRAVEDFVEDLLTEAGVPELDQLVDRVIFATFISNLFTEDTQAHWLAGTLTRIDATKSAGNIYVDFDDSAHMVLTATFAALLSPFTNAQGCSVSGGRAYINRSSVAPGEALMSASSFQIVGGWQWDFQVDTLLQATDLELTPIAAGFQLNTPSASTRLLFTAYSIRVVYDGSLLLMKYDGAGAFSSIGSSTWPADTSNHTLRFTRTPQGRMRVYLDGVQKIDVTDATITSSTVSIVSTLQEAGGGNDWYVDNYYTTSTMTSTHVSRTLDALMTPKSWGTIEITKTTPGSSTIVVTTRASEDGISWDSYVALGVANQVESALRRYLQIRIVFTAFATQNVDPVVEFLELDYRNNATLIRLGNFTGKTCYQAIQDFGKFANYEFGFNEDETFFFRSRDVDETVDIAFDGSIQTMDVTHMGNGYDKVYSEVQANYGNFNITLTDPGTNDQGPTARFAKRRLSLDSSSILIDQDTDIATGVAGGYFNYYSRPRRRFKIKTKLYPHVELSDTAQLTYRDHSPTRPFFLGDLTVYQGDPGLEHFGGGDQAADTLLCKVVGLRHDTEGAFSEFDLEEIFT